MNGSFSDCVTVPDFEVEIKVTDRTFTSALEDPTSVEYMRTKTEMETNVR